jgi:hypothetical protein
MMIDWWLRLFRLISFSTGPSAISPVVIVVCLH